MKSKHIEGEYNVHELAFLEAGTNEIGTNEVFEVKIHPNL
jgi:hypothetical protein